MVLICDVCNYKEFPNFNLVKKLKGENIMQKEFPMHCNQSMRLTILNIVKERAFSIDKESVIARVVGTVQTYFIKKLMGDTGNKFSRSFKRKVEEIPEITDLFLLNELPSIVAQVLVEIECDEKEADVIKALTDQIIVHVEKNARARMNTKKRKEGPVIPGSNPSVDLKYFCSECKELLDIPEDIKQKLFKGDEGVSLPEHHGKVVEVQIINHNDDKVEEDRKDENVDYSPFELPEKDPEEMDVTSVGIDIGSSTTHLIISKLHLLKEENFFNMTRRFNVVERKILYKGKILYTPLLNTTTIDIDAVANFCREEFKNAGISPEEIDTGAVIVTGETAKKENAKDIVEKIAGETGKFVSATAGPNFESVLAALGNGSVARSLDKQNTILSVDVGGGTSNMAILSHGKILSTACTNVGGRLLGIDSENKIWRIDPPVQRLMDRLGVEKKIGDVIGDEEIDLISTSLADALCEVMTQNAESETAKDLMMTDDLDLSIKVDEVIFSGGVSEYIYGEGIDSDDIGKRLAEKIMKHKLDATIVEPESKIRATVIGAGSYSLSLSGSTCFYDDSILFPLNNVPVLVVNAEKEKFSPDHVVNQIRSAFQRNDVREGDETIALYFEDPIYRSEEYLKPFAEAIEKALPNSVEKNRLVILLFESDIGSMVGITLRNETKLGTNLICLDELEMKEGDWIDIGKPLYAGHTFPVTVKSLVFN